MFSIQNRVQLIGRVGRDPEILELESGKKRARFSMATDDFFTNPQGERVKNTEWHNIIFWNKSAEVIEKYVFKGNEIAVEGKLTTRSWEDPSGAKHFITEIIGSQILFLGNKTNLEKAAVADEI